MSDSLENTSVESELTAQRVKFCQAYVANSFNGTQAAITAGYSEDTAGVKASQLLAIVKVKEYVKELSRDATEAAKVSAEWVIKEAVENLKAAKEADRYSDVNKSIELLGRYLTIWTDKQEIDHKGLPEVSIYLPDNERGSE